MVKSFRYSPARERRRNVVLLRALLLAATGGLLLASLDGVARPAALALLVGFLLTDIVLLLLPLRIVHTFRFDLVIGGLDTLFLALGIHFAGASLGALPVSCLLMALVVALAHFRLHAVAGATAVSALHAWFVLGAAAATPGSVFAVQMLLLGSVALYYGYLVEGLHRVRSLEEAEHLSRRELVTLLDILDAITSSLDLYHVTGTIVRKITTLIPATRCSMLLVEQPSDRCFVMASHDDPNLRMLEIDLKKYPEVRKAIETRQSVMIRDVASDPLLEAVRDGLKHMDFLSIMVVPLTFGDDVLGTLCIKTARANREFSERELNFCNAVARASANALKNALLHHQVTDESRRHRRTGRMLSSVLDHTPDLVLTTNSAGEVTEFNFGAETLLGHRKNDVIGTAGSELFEEGGAELIQQVLSGATLDRQHCRLRRFDGDVADLELNLAPLKDDADRVVGVVCVGHDISELKATQLQLLQAEKLSAIGEIISGVAHELNNPLSGVLGFSQLLMGRHEATPISADLEKIHDSALRCQKIVRNLLAFARGHAPTRKYLGVNGIIEKTLDLKRYRLQVNDIEVRTELEPGLPRTMLDFHRIQQVLLNLINNAEHAMNGNGDRPGRLFIRTSSVSGAIRIEVTDNGTGMDSKTRERIFDPFFTTKEEGKGTGLGLSVSYGIVKEHGGRIQARSRKGEGTTFVIELPVLADESAPDEPESRDERPVARRHDTLRGHLLVVDDEPMILDLLIDILGEAGHRVDSAASGAEACRKVAVRGYDLVISDVRMPQMSGTEMYRKVLALRPEMKGRIVFMSGDLIDEGTARFLEETGAPAVAKPVEIAELLETVARILERSAARVPRSA